MSVMGDICDECIICSSREHHSFPGSVPWRVTDVAPVRVAKCVVKI